MRTTVFGLVGDSLLVQTTGNAHAPVSIRAEEDDSSEGSTSLVQLSLPAVDRLIAALEHARAEVRSRR